MSTDSLKNVISMRDGSLAVFLNIDKKNSQARIIGRDIKDNWEIFIIFYDGKTKKYISLGSASKKVFSFNVDTIKPSNNYLCCGAAIGIYGKKEFFEGMFEGFVYNIKDNDKNNENIEEIKKAPVTEKPKEIKIETNENLVKEKVEDLVVIPQNTDTDKNIELSNNENTQEQFIKDNLDNPYETAEDILDENETQMDIEDNKNISMSSKIEPSIENKMIYDEYASQKDIHNTFKDIVKKFKTEMDELEKAEIFTKEEIESIYKSADETKEKNDTNNLNEQKEENAKHTNKSEIKYGIEYIFQNNEKLYPFKDNTYDWVRVCMDELWLLPIKSKDILNPLIMLSSIKYKHIMLGRSTDKKSIILAVPEKFNRSDVKNAYALGFKDFWRCSEQNDNYVFGYWIKNIN